MATFRDVSAQKRLEIRQELLARTSDWITSADDERVLADRTARLFVPDLADWCAVDFWDETSGRPVRMAAAHRDPATADAVPARPATPDQGKMGPRAGITATSIAVPLSGRQGVLGIMTLGMSANGRRFDSDQFQLAQDVVSQAALAIENARLFKKARDASRAKDEFLAILGHELRNPLAPISNALSLLQLKGGSGLEQEISVISRQVAHMTRLVDDLLDVTRIAQRRLELRVEEVDLNDVVAEGLEIVAPIVEKKSITVSVHVRRGAFRLRGDRRRLAQVVANLVNNAAKWSSPGQTIEIAARLEGDRNIALSVRDRGAGIAADLLPRIFDLFVQSPQSGDRAAGGLGVGLALVRNLVDLHGGTVSASSAGLGTGSEFTVRLPALDAAAATQPQTDGLGSSPSPSSAAASGRATAVLLVDDNTDAADMLAEILGLNGFAVRVAHNAAEAVGALAEFTPDVALLDIGLPVVDGYELGRRLRDHVGKVRLIALSGYAQESDRQRSAACGFEAHVAKPVRWEQLIPLLRAEKQGGVETGREAPA